MVVTPRAAYLDEARRWIEKLDQPGGNSPEAQLFVYPVQNGNAKHLVEVLNGLFGGNTPAASTSSSVKSGVAPGLPTSTTTTGGFRRKFRCCHVNGIGGHPGGCQHHSG